MTRAGFPPTRVFGGTSLVTTEPAATTEFSPTVTPPMIVAAAAIQTFLSITTGFAITKARRREGSTGWPDVMMFTFGLSCGLRSSVYPRKMLAFVPVSGHLAKVG
jgi:hypothetical protein